MSVRISATRRTQRATANPAPVAAPESTQSAADTAASAETLTRRLHRLALDVHDGPMQNLAVIGFSLGDLRRRMSALLPPEHQTNIDAGLEQITDELGKVESELRALIGALEDGASKSVPLREAIETEIRTFERHCEARVAFVFDDNARAETDSQRIALQSVTREALANVAKHSGATRVTIRLYGSAEVTTLEIEDNGCGVREEDALTRGRMGLAGMKRRVELLGGEFRFASRPGGPTTVTASLQAWRPEAS